MIPASLYIYTRTFAHFLPPPPPATHDRAPLFSNTSCLGPVQCLAAKTHPSPKVLRESEYTELS